MFKVNSPMVVYLFLLKTTPLSIDYCLLIIDYFKKLI
jgi:hypothetical protein